MLIPFPWKRQEHVPFKCPDSASCRQKCETQWIYCIFFVVSKIKGIQQQLIQNFQEIPSTFYELAVNYINNSPIHHKSIEIFPGFHITYFPFTGLSFGCRSWTPFFATLTGVPPTLLPTLKVCNVADLGSAKFQEWMSPGRYERRLTPTSPAGKST